MIFWCNFLCTLCDLFFYKRSSIKEFFLVINTLDGNQKKIYISIWKNQGNSEKNVDTVLSLLIFKNIELIMD